MASARVDRVQTKNWIMGLHPVSADVANGLIDQGVALSELGGIDPSYIEIICSATIKPGVTVDDPTAAREIDPMQQIQNPGVNVLAIPQLKLSVSVTAALYYEVIGRPIIPSIINWDRIRQFKLYVTACEEWEDPADLPVCSNDVSIL